VLEFFIEGGRSRSGKVLRPKMGMLSVITNTVLEGQVDDAMIVPVAISYDKVPHTHVSRAGAATPRVLIVPEHLQVIEGEAYKKELLGGQKEPETVAGVIRAARLLKFKFGRVDVNISTIPHWPFRQCPLPWDRLIGDNVFVYRRRHLGQAVHCQSVRPTPIACRERTR
jgi:glycerol-3-phosphate O-acyltransferase